MQSKIKEKIKRLLALLGLFLLWLALKAFSIISKYCIIWEQKTFEKLFTKKVNTLIGDLFKGKYKKLEILVIINVKINWFIIVIMISLI